MNLPSPGTNLGWLDFCDFLITFLDATLRLYYWSKQDSDELVCRDNFNMRASEGVLEHTVKFEFLE